MGDFTSDSTAPVVPNRMKAQPHPPISRSSTVGKEVLQVVAPVSRASGHPRHGGWRIERKETIPATVINLETTVQASTIKVESRKALQTRAAIIRLHYCTVLSYATSIVG